MTDDEKKQMSRLKQVVVPLVFPIDKQGTEVDSITVRRLKARDQIEVQNMENPALYFIAKATDLDPEEIQDLDLADYQAINEVLEAFMSARAPKSVKPV